MHNEKVFELIDEGFNGMQEAVGILTDLGFEDDPVADTCRSVGEILGVMRERLDKAHLDIVHAAVREIEEESGEPNAQQVCDFISENKEAPRLGVEFIEECLTRLVRCGRLSSMRVGKNPRTYTGDPEFLDAMERG